MDLRLQSFQEKLPMHSPSLTKGIHKGIPTSPLAFPTDSWVFVPGKLSLKLLQWVPSKTLLPGTHFSI